MQYFEQAGIAQTRLSQARKVGVDTFFKKIIYFILFFFPQQ